MNNENLKLIGKYAIILSITYVLEVVFNALLEKFYPENLTSLMYALISMSPIALSFLLNVVTAIVVYKDKTDKGIEGKYVIIATILYRPVGVVVFLLYSIYGRSITGGETNIENPALSEPIIEN